MEKRALFLFFLLSFSLSFLSLASAENPAPITTQSITGETTSSTFGVTITLVGSPTLTLEKPQNKTYSTSQNIRVLAESNANYAWFNLDAGANKSLSEDNDEFGGYFNTTGGSHTLYIFANNTNNDVTKTNITFYVDTGLLYVDDTEYQGSNRGNSTNTGDYSHDEYNNLSSFTIENTNSGKIVFKDLINLTNDDDPSDSVVNITLGVNISYNRIEIDTDILPNFNKNATLTLSGLSFTNPRILRDGSVCASSICSQNNYSGGILSFNVTHFTIYSAEETPDSSESPSSGGGGGGGGSSIPNFAYSPDKLSVSLKQGATIIQEISITNTQGVSRVFEIIPSENIKNIVKIDENLFTLGPLESRRISVDFIAREDAPIDFYIGKFTIKTSGVSKEIPVIITVDSPKTLLDVKVEIPQRYLSVRAGEEIIANIKLFNLGEVSKLKDINIEYEIRDFNGNIIIKESETVAVETSTSITKEFIMPEDAPEGFYVLYVKTTTIEGEVASSTQLFNVRKMPLKTEQIYVYILLGIILLFMLIVIWEIRKVKKEQRMHYYKISGKELTKQGYIKNRPARKFARAFKK